MQRNKHRKAEKAKMTHKKMTDKLRELEEAT